MEKLEMEQQRDHAADGALEARSRIEAAVDAGVLPIWVLETCELWERSALVYGKTSAQLALSPKIPLPVLQTVAAGHRLH